MPSTPGFSRKLRDVPRDPDIICIECGNPDCCLAHLPYFDTSANSKTYDICGAHLCRACHDYCDGPGRKDYEFRFRVLSRTLKRLWRENKIHD